MSFKVMTRKPESINMITLKPKNPMFGHDRRLFLNPGTKNGSSTLTVFGLK